MRTLIYCRVSLDTSGQGRSVAEQEAECRAWAEREGWDVVDVIAETGSASRYARSTGARARWDEVTEALASSGVDILLTWEASRATRDLTAYADLRDLCAKHSVMWGYSGTVYNLADRSDRFRTGLDALMSEDESARISERIQRSVRARAQAGEPHGKIPYGYRREYDPATGALHRQVPDEETAPVVREIFRRVADGEGLHTIAVDLTRRQVPIPRPPRTRRKNDGAAWIARTVQRIATNPTNAGLRTHKGEIIGDAAWPALVDRELFDKVQAILSDPVRITRTGDSNARWLLSGIATCALCDGPMRVYSNRGAKTYTCHWCYKVTRKADVVDQHVTDRVLALLAHMHLADDTSSVDAELEQARGELDALRSRLDGFTDAAADGELTPKALARIEARLRPQIAAAQAKVRHLSAPAALSEFDLTDPAAFWENATIEEKRAVLRSTVRVVIHPAGRGKRIFDPALVDVTPAW